MTTSNTEKYTSGPWEVIADCEKQTWFIDANKQSVACVSMKYSNEANARLIVAAPELLEVLKEVTVFYDLKLDFKPLIDLINREIAKMEGK